MHSLFSHSFLLYEKKYPTASSRPTPASGCLPPASANVRRRIRTVVPRHSTLPRECTSTRHLLAWMYEGASARPPHYIEQTGGSRRFVLTVSVSRLLGSSDVLPSNYISKRFFVSNRHLLPNSGRAPCLDFLWIGVRAYWTTIRSTSATTTATATSTVNCYYNHSNYSNYCEQLPLSAASPSLFS